MLLIEIILYPLNKMVSINSTVSKIFQTFLLEELFDLKIKGLNCLTNSSFNRNHRVLRGLLFKRCISRKRSNNCCWQLKRRCLLTRLQNVRIFLFHIIKHIISTPRSIRLRPTVCIYQIYYF